MAQDDIAELQQLAEEIRRCTACALHETRSQSVPGEGRVDARIMFVGEAPGYHEDKQSRPFVGAAGRFLDELLAGIGLARSDVFITNIVKSRPPQNRDPRPEEIEACRPWLDAQLKLIRPRVLVTLGRFSMEHFISGVTISRVHGQERRVGDQLVFPMFHPAAALHQPRYRAMIEEDFQKLSQLLARLENAGAGGNAPAAAADEKPEQLSLF